MPVNPKMPATIETTKKIRAHFRSVTANSSSPGRPPPRREIPDLTFGGRTGSSRWRRLPLRPGEQPEEAGLLATPLALSPCQRQHCTKQLAGARYVIDHPYGG